MTISQAIRDSLAYGKAAKSVLENMYLKSPYGFTGVMVVPRQRIHPEVMHRIISTLLMRANSFYADILIRTLGSKVCNPHLRSDFNQYMRNKDGSLLTKNNEFIIDTRKPFVSKSINLSFDKKWNINDKLNASLGQSIVYAYRQCSKKYNGAVLPLFIVTKSGEQHANMIYMNFKTNPVRVLLFEPNGRMFYSSAGALRSVRQAVREANDISRQQLFVVDIPEGFCGVQSALSIASNGIGICGAVTFWVLYVWMREQAAKMKFSEFTYKFAETIKQDPLKYRTQMYMFLQSSYKAINSKSGRESLRKYLGHAMPRNMQYLSDIPMVYTVQLGRVKVKGSVEI